jgi:hypothetical protein
VLEGRFHKVTRRKKVRSTLLGLCLVVLVAASCGFPQLSDFPGEGGSDGGMNGSDGGMNGSDGGMNGSDGGTNDGGPPQVSTGASPDMTISYTCTWNSDTSAAFLPGDFPIPGVFAALIPVNGLSFTAGGSLQCGWSNGTNTNLTLQGDGNFVFYNQTNGKTLAAHTRKVSNPNGPGVAAAFQSDANLVVRNAAGQAIWASNTHTFPNAVLAFQSDGDLVIWNRTNTSLPGFVDPFLWDTGTE